ncbi:hypothetical protein KTH44_10905 [Acinetobacter bereziniae]|uniref:NACHT domain-containing protein n=1 Tax=Acinetobacter bereziniae TaxID=106648 RepID=UPI0021CDB065|nr:hypothetical protein [Acinetobacter bereziniae]MCU4319634.1 hypothetical protein [Acinetobacter bereziniae]
MNDYIPLNRKFSLVSSKKNLDVSNLDYSLSIAYGDTSSWDDLLAEYRCVILAEAGAGKTKEFEECAKRIQAEGKFSFFIRIEDIDNDFVNEFEIGDEDQFNKWINSTDPAWFFLDSVDEARLLNAKQFRRAIRKFASRIKSAARRSHVYISSRPYSWQFESDEKFLDTELFYGVKNEEHESNQKDQIKSILKVFELSPLNVEDIKRFCEIRLVENIPSFLNEIERFDLLGFAERPFDLDSIINKWKNDGALGSRSEIIKYNIQQRLTDMHTSDRKSINISLDKLYEGAQRLAAAVILTRRAGINVSSSNFNIKNINPVEILPEWTPDERLSLLSCAIFNDIVYDAVRFRHRDIREFLAAQWFLKLLRGDNRLAVESLFFREQFGEKIITPSLRSILPWLILEDEKICQYVLNNEPELAFESGDPSQLTHAIRNKIFVNFVERIANNLDNRSVRDNDSIAKISNKDLEEDVLALIKKYSANEDVIFFLGRMVWQGQLNKCVPALIDIALNQATGLYARRIATRAVMACRAEPQKMKLWNALNISGEVLDRKLIVELVSEVDKPTKENIELLIESLKNSATYVKYEYSGLNRALKKITEKCNAELKFYFLTGLATLLNTAPYIEKGNCKISSKYGWCLKLAYTIIEQLIDLSSELALDDLTLEILVNGQLLVHYSDYDDRDEKNNLRKLISDWTCLNEALYWKTIETARNLHRENKNEELTDDWEYCYYGQFWEFNSKNFKSFLDYIFIKESDTDKLIILNRAYLTYNAENKPEWMFEQLKQAVQGNSILTNRLKELVSPFISEKMMQYTWDDQAEKEERENQVAKNKIAKKQWIESLQHDPKRLIKNSNFLEGYITNDLCWLMKEFRTVEISTERDNYANWKHLIPEFGEAVALAYREALTKFWKIYKPKLHSEEILTKGSIPGEVILGLAGLKIEANEDHRFPNNLESAELSHALRYLSWDINGFPSWLEKCHQSFPNEVVEAVMKEVIWELRQSNADSKENYSHILHDLLYHAPWIHNSIAVKIYQWLEHNSKLLHNDTKKYALQILLNSNIEKEQFVTLANQKIEESQSIKDKAWWLALLVDSDPETGLKITNTWLKELSLEDAKYATQIFVCHLLGERNSINGRAGKEEYKKIEHLKVLYLLVHKYIKHEEDIHRTGTGVYSPGLRDHAQEARDLLFKYLQEVPNSESYYVLKELAVLQADPDRKLWFNKLATKIALTCGDIESCSVDSVLQLEKSGNINPTTHRMLFDLALLKILELKDWLENGDDSAAKTWIRVPDETEMRNLISNVLKQKSNSKYTISQEDELANGQRTDIKFHNANVNSPVPVELKILDKSWTGTDLCERLRNQLVGDYLRESNATCGIFLLVSKECEKKWKINSRLTNLTNLESSLENYWQGIAKDWSNVDSIKVIVIDLNKRSIVSRTLN